MTTKLPSIFDFPAGEHESQVPFATEKNQHLIARAALAAVCRHWNITPIEVYADKRDFHHRQARSALCVLMAGNTLWTRHQIARFTGRRNHTRITRDIANASQWPNMDQHYTTRLNRAERDLNAGIAELNSSSPLAAEADRSATAPAPSPPTLDGSGEGRGEGSKHSTEGGAA